MGHVDDAHDAEGDRQADRRQQQDRAQAHALIDVERDLHPEQVVLDALQRFLGGQADRFVLLRRRSVVADADQRRQKAADRRRGIF